jgi:hypothetical protein
LYNKEPGGRPGKFITGKISGDDIKKLKNTLGILVESPRNSDSLSDKEKFKRNKILWMTKSRILKDSNAIKNIPKKAAIVKIYHERNSGEAKSNFQ